MISRMAALPETSLRASRLNNRWQGSTRCQIINKWDIKGKDRWPWIHRSLHSTTILRLDHRIRLSMSNRVSGTLKCLKIWACRFTEECRTNLITSWLQHPLWCPSSLWCHKSSKISNKCRPDSKSHSNNLKELILELHQKWLSRTLLSKSRSCSHRFYRIWSRQLS